MGEIAQENGITLSAQTIDQKFKELIIFLDKERGKVVILIDEYDEPIIDYLGDQTEKSIENREIMMAFYSVLKGADPHLKLVFITGVSKGKCLL